MTTVVFDGSMLATDSQSTRHLLDGSHCPACTGEIGTTHIFKNKLMLAHSGVMFRDQKVLAWAGAGAVPVIDAVTMALRKNMDLEQAVVFSNKLAGGRAAPDRDGCTVLVVTEESCWELEVRKMSVAVKEITQFPHAIGSGRKAALFAVKWLGLTAFGGVAAAADVDPSTSGNINWYMCRPSDGDELAKSVISDEFTAEEFKALMKERARV